MPSNAQKNVNALKNSMQQLVPPSRRLSRNSLLKFSGENECVTDNSDESLVDTMILKVWGVGKRLDEIGSDGDINVSLGEQLKGLATAAWIMESRGLFCEMTCRKLLRMRAPFKMDHQDMHRQTRIEDFFSVK